MEGLYQNKYRIKSTRLPGWDYGVNAYYFVTICAHNRAHYFGDVLIDDHGEAFVALSEIGGIARDELLKTPEIRPYVQLDEYIIMPNHMHAIFQIDKSTPNVETPRRGVSTLRVCEQRDKYELSNKPKSTHNAPDIVVAETIYNATNETNETPRRGVSTGTVDAKPRKPMHRAEWKPGVLGSIINQFKGAVKRQCNEFGYDFQWQPRYHDSIVKNELILNKIREYIKNNPKMWHRDRNNRQGIFM